MLGVQYILREKLSTFSAIHIIMTNIRSTLIVHFNNYFSIRS